MGCNFSGGNVYETARHITKPNAYVSFRINKVFSVYIYETQKSEPWQIFCKIIIGDAQKQTSPKIQGPRQIPTWGTQIMNFKIPSSVSSGIIEVYQIHLGKTTKLGFAQFDLQVISDGHEVHEYNQRLTSCVEKKNVGSVSFQTIGSQNGVACLQQPFSAVLPHKVGLKKTNTSYKQNWQLQNYNGLIILGRQSDKETSGEKSVTQMKSKQRQIIKRRLLEPLPVLPAIYAMSPNKLNLQKRNTTVETKHHKLEQCENEEEQSGLKLKK